ncbi:hypothetical protein PGT21_016814 [Puccinia graminis f. sp. tritici]|uniref:Uncharacterized protein n=1 Tax=Puccinia graminis f. sp. tritici TaxID=56615 RepID=A0A5B0MUM0_PUCGR|nr:hypothetical protein PGT21_016814 [Puccinia graminis f. sp. tritici]
MGSAIVDIGAGTHPYRTPIPVCKALTIKEFVVTRVSSSVKVRASLKPSHLKLHLVAKNASGPAALGTLVMLLVSSRPGSRLQCELFDGVPTH